MVRREMSERWAPSPEARCRPSAGLVHCTPTRSPEASSCATSDGSCLQSSFHWTSLESAACWRTGTARTGEQQAGRHSGGASGGCFTLDRLRDVGKACAEGALGALKTGTGSCRQSRELLPAGPRGVHPADFSAVLLVRRIHV